MKKNNIKIKNFFKPINLTEGNVYKVIILFALPIFVSYIFQQVYSLCDAAIIGNNLTESEVNGVNDTGSIMFIFLQFVLGCTAGFSVITSEYFGNKDVQSVRRSLFTQLVLGFSITIILTILAVLLIKPLLGLIGLNEVSGGETYKSAYIYLYIIFIGLFSKIFFNIICSFLRASGDSITPLIFLIISTILNVVLDVVFIVCLKMRVDGAVIATVISETISFIGCTIFMFLKYPQFRLSKSDFHINIKDIYLHLRNGLPLALQFSILAIGLITMQSSLINFDTSVNGIIDPNGPSQLCYRASCKLINFLVTILNALATAMLSFTAQNDGINNMERIKNGIKASLHLLVLFSIVIGCLFLLSTINEAYLHLFYSPEKINRHVILYGNYYIYLLVCTYFWLGALIVYRSIIQGMSKPLYPFLAGVMELIARILICIFLPQLINQNPINSTVLITENPRPYIALCIADPAAWILGLIPVAFGIYKVIYKNPKKLILKF